jgi:hypothetical protein
MSFDSDLPLSQHDILDAEDCAEICARVLALRNRWTERSPGRFYTLGTAAYLDATDKRDAYLAAARETNPILQENFDAVLELVREFFEELLGDAAFYNPHLALPGFHIFTSQYTDLGKEDIAARAHFDMQWMEATPGHEPQATLSFTLPIEQPNSGACLAVWPFRYMDAVRLGYAACDYAAQNPWQRVAYEPGRIVVHDGYVLHAIGPRAGAAPNEYRITLQGHGVRMPAGWMLYW